MPKSDTPASPPKLPEKFEDVFTRLEAIVARLEGGEAALEESLELYAEGMALVRFCGEKLTSAQQKIERLNQAADSATPTPATGADGD